MEKEAKKPWYIRIMFWSRRKISGRLIRLSAIGCGVADCAVVGDPRKADGLLSKTDGHLVPFLPHNSERAVAARAGQMVGANARHGDPDPVRNASIIF